MRFPTLPEIIDASECLMFGHSWRFIKEDRHGFSVYKCSNCGEVERRP